MEHAKRMILVDERVFNSLRTNSWEKPMENMLKKIDSSHQLSWKKPLDQRIKSNLVKDMTELLNDTEIDDSVKSKLLAQTLTKFRHTGSTLPVETTGHAPEETEDLIDLNAEPAASTKKAKRNKKAKALTVPYSPIKTRTRKRPIRWVEY